MGGSAEAVLIWGAGGHGRVVAELARATGFRVAGYVDRDAGKLDRQVDLEGGRVLAVEARFLAALAEGARLPGDARWVVPAVGENGDREVMLRAAGAAAIPLAPPLVHPFAWVSPSARLGPGSVVLAGAVINAGAVVGEGAIVNTGAIVEHDCRVGRAAHVAPGAVLAGGVMVGARAWVGAAAVVREGAAIGEDAIVGAGAVVVSEVGPGETVAGNPARPLRRREDLSYSSEPAPDPGETP